MVVMTSLALLLGLALAGQDSGRLVIPDEIFIELSTEELESAADNYDPEDPRIDLAARTMAVSKVAYADEVRLAGHIERIDEGHLIVVGRRIDAEFADLIGGARTALEPGTLVAIEGTGTPSGVVRARRVEVIATRDPARWSKLVPELNEFKKKYWEQAQRYDDPELTAYLQRLADRLTPHYIPDRERSIKIHVVENPDINAFALPDGDIVLHTGIIARLENEAQLASVIGHEIAHVTQGHTIRSMAKETQHKLIGWGALLASLALGMTGEADAAQGVQLMSSAWLSGYSRAHEDEADQVGLRGLYLAGYDVAQAPEVWRQFRLLYGPQSREANFFYGSHSTPRDREHDLQAEIWKAYEPSGLLGGRIGRARYLRATAKVVRDNALLDLERGLLTWADWGIAKSLALAPEDPDTWVAAGRLSMGRGGDHAGDAAAAFERAIELAPDHAEAHRELGFARRELGDDDAARRAFERYLALTPEADDAPAIRGTLEQI